MRPLALLMLLAGCAGAPPLPPDHPANPAAPAGTVIPPVALDGYLTPDALMARAAAAARAPQSHSHMGH